MIEAVTETLLSNALQRIGIRINILHLVVTNDITQNRLDGVPDKTVYKLNINIKVLLSK